MPNPVPLGATCHCGAISIKIPHPPAFIHDCNCSFCLNTGAVWGYYAASEVSITGKVARYARADLTEPALYANFCPTCGASTHWGLTEAAKARAEEDRVGVNMRLFDERDLAGVELRFPDGRSWAGVGHETTYRRPPIILCRDGSF